MRLLESITQPTKEGKQEQSMKTSTLTLCGLMLVSLISGSAIALARECPSEMVELGSGGFSYSVPPTTAADERHYAAELCRKARRTNGTVLIDAKGCYWTVEENWAGQPELSRARGVNFQPLCEARSSADPTTEHNLDRARDR